MDVFYTYTYGKNGHTVKVQDRVAEAATALGYRELSIYCDVAEKNIIEQCDLDVQMDGSFSAFSNDAVLLMQYPCGAGYRYDKAIMDHARMYGGAKVIIYNHPHALEGGVSPEQEQELFDQADIVIEPCRIAGLDEFLYTQKEIIDALLAATYTE